MKKCPKCERIRGLTEFYAASSRFDGLAGWCKSCCAKRINPKNLNRVLFDHKSLVGTGTKYCPTCKKTKENSFFGRDRANPGGFRGQCKECSKVAYKRTRPSTAIFLSESERKLRKRASETVNSNYLKVAKKYGYPECLVCGDKDQVEGHHEDYSAPFDILWLCQAHHTDLHTKKRKEKPQFIHNFYVAGLKMLRDVLPKTYPQ